MIGVIVVASLGAAFLFASSAVLQQREAHAAAEAQQATTWTIATARGFARLIQGLVRNRLWIIGWFVGLGGFVVQAIALYAGSVAIVQPFMATEVLWALVIRSFMRRRMPPARAVAYMLSIAGALAILLTAARSVTEGGSPDRWRVLLAVVIVTVVVCGLVVFSRGRSVQVASFALASGAGICFAMSAVFMKMTTEDLLDHGVAHTAADWPGYLLAVSTLSSLLLEQAAFASGTLPWAYTAMSVMNPIAGYIAGILIFHVTIPHTAADLFAVVVVGVLLTIGIAGLSQLPAVRGVEEPDTGV